MKRALLVCIFVLVTAAISTAQNTTIYFPHVVDGNLGGSTVWKTTIFLTNPAVVNTAPANVMITFTQQSSTNTATSASGAGSAFNVKFVDQNGNAVASSGNTVSFQIAGGQTEVLVSTAAGAYAGGFATVSSSQPVSGTAIFSEFTPSGQLIGEAGVPAASAVASQAVFVDTVGGYNTGIAFANPGTAPANVTLSLVNTSGATVATTTQVLGPGNHNAAFTSQFFPSFATPLAGLLQITTSATTPLSAIALRFDPTFSIFTTLPPVTIATPSPALTLASVAPAKATLSGTVTLTGTGFSTTPSSDTVVFTTATGTTSVSPSTATATSLTLSVPTTAISGPVTVQTGGQTSSAVILEILANSTTFAQSAVTIAAGGTVSGVDIYVDPPAASASNILNGTEIGVAPVGATSIPFNEVSATVAHGSQMLVLIYGTGISQANGTALTFSGSGITVSNVSYGTLSNSTYMVAQIAVDSGAALGSRNVILTNSNLDVSILSGGLIIQ